MTEEEQLTFKGDLNLLKEFLGYHFYGTVVISDESIHIEVPGVSCEQLRSILMRGETEYGLYKED